MGKGKAVETKMSENLILWSEITDLCLELRKSFSRKKYPAMSEDELVRKVFSDIASIKESNWVSKKS